MINKKPILRFGSGFETPELKKDVQELQTLLKQGGFLPETAPIDGLFDHQTEKAVKLFQNSKNLESDGVVNFETWSYLELLFEPNSSLINNAINLDYTDTFKEISSHSNQGNKHHILRLGDGINTPELQDEVKYLQELLKDNHCLEETSLTDGLFWRKTEAAVIKFQKSRNLVADGIVNEETWHNLETQVIQATLEKDQIKLPSINVNLNQENIKTIIQLSQNELTEKYPTLMMGDGLNTPHLQTAVKSLQQLLQKQGLLGENFALDGFFWIETETAIKQLQQNNNLEENGIVTQEIWEILESNLTVESVESLDHKLEEKEVITPQQITISPEQIKPVEVTNFNNLEASKSINMIEPSANISYHNLTIGDGLNTPELQEEVKYLQKLLENQGFFPENFCVDGLFWQETEMAVKAFQNQNNLPQTGIVNTATWLALENEKYHELILSKNQEQTNQFAFKSQFLKSEDLTENVIENTNLITEIPENQEIKTDNDLTLKLGAGIDTPELQEQVKYLQTLLQEWGILGLDLEVNGLFWRETQEAVKKFQQQHNLTVDGIVNQNTWQVLKGLSPISEEFDQSNLTENLPENQPIKPEFETILEVLKPTDLSLPPISESQENENIINQSQPKMVGLNLPSSKKINKNYSNLKLGDGIYNESLKDEVKYLQTLLKRHNFLPQDAEIDGLFWHKTENAVKEFQKSRKLVADGIVGNLTWNALEEVATSLNLSNTVNKNANLSNNNYPILKIGDGMTNTQLQPDIKRLQKLLQKHQFFPQDQTIDGLFWRETEKAVKAFQKSKNLVADGVVADKTWKALEKEPVKIAVNYSSQKPVLKLRDGIDTPHLKDEVILLQNLLKKWNVLNKNTISDGLFWKSTEEAVKAFQKSQNLVVDGVVGAKTWQLLEKTPPITPSKPTIINNQNMNRKEPILKLRDGVDTPHLKDEVQRLQTLLKKWKFLPDQSPIDGLFLQGTETAVKAFQKSRNLTADGVVGDKTWEFLKKNPEPINVNKYPVLKLGDGIKTPQLIDAVKRLQLILKTYRFLPENTVIDGLFGEETETAVKLFQQTQNLTADGVIGEKTWQFLESLIDGKSIVRPVLKIQDGIDFPDLINEVKSLQNLLRERNLIRIADGLFGKDTENAVKIFQRNNNLMADGVVGKGTWSLLSNQNITTYVPLRKFSNVNLVNTLINAISNTTIKRFASQSIPLILQEAQKYNVTDKGQIAYILATAQHESRLGQWMVEFASGQAYEGRRDLGNTQPGDGVRYKGRGFVQITGRRNYTDWSQRLGIDLVNNPHKATDFAIAAKILVLGMRDGTFTSRRLSQYVSGSMRDFYNARRVINGLDQATHIAGLAQNFFTAMS